MALNIDGSKIGAVQYNGLTIGEAMMDGKIVYRSTHPLIKSKPDYWYTMENGAHWLNRGTKDPIMHYPRGIFADRGDYAYTSGALGRVEVTEAWDESFTIAGWYDIRARSTTSYFFTRAMPGDWRNVVYVISTSATDHSYPSTVGFRIRSSTDQFSAWVYAPPNIIPDAEWFHIAVVGDHPAGSRNRLKLYINGVFVFEASFPSEPKLNIPAGTPVGFGAFLDDATSNPLYANVDDLAIWNRALSDNEVSSIHNAGPVPTAMLTPPPPYQQQLIEYTNIGYALVDIPSWVTEIDYVMIGGGGGGDRGNSAISQTGLSGKAGTYAVGTFHPNENQMGMLVGSGGLGTTGSAHNPTDGGASAIFNQAGTAIIAEAPGGAAQAHQRGAGESPGDMVYKTIWFGGGTGGAPNSDGTAPGGGGGGGSGGIFGIFQRGRPGGRGQVALMMKSQPT